MIKYKITLSDGTVLYSGQEADARVRSVTLTEQVSDQDDLCPGAACAACAEIELWAPENKVQIAQGEELVLTRVDTTAGTETQVGIFLAEKPEKSSANVYTVTAYDRMTLLDKDLSPWLREQQESFPMGLTAFIQAVCAQCGVTLADGALDGLPNGGYQIAAFYADGLTGRQLIQWAAQAACRFARMTPDGKLTFGWYAASDAAIGPGTTYREGVVVLADGSVLYTANGERYVVRDPLPAYLQGSLSYEDYETAPIDKVQIRQTDDDVGVIYPPEETGTNALVLQGNLLLTTATAEALQPVAQAIFETMQGVSYTPLQLSVLVDSHTPPLGGIIQVTDAYGRVMTAYVMTRTISGQKATLECTGNATRDGVSAVNSQKYQNLQGKVLELQMGVDGLRITNRDLQGGLASLQLTVDGLETTVEQNYRDLTDYVDQETGQIKDEAVNEAVQQAVQQVDETLTFYPTTVEMNSAIQQSASQIQLSVSQTLTGYSTTSQMQQYVNGQTSGILQDAQDYTDSELERYPTTIEMNSAIQQSASNINLSVDSKLTMYPTNSEMQDYVDDQTANLPTTSTVQNMIDIGIDGITLSAATNGNSSTIILRHDGAQISSANITFTGFVTFSDLSGSGTSTINGDNITTGQIGSASGNTLYDLDAGTLRTGRSSGNHVNINDRGITWYVVNGSTSYLTGVLYSVYGESWIGANSNYVNYGWVNSATPSSYRGMRVDNTGSRVSFNTSHVDVESGDLGVSGGISTRNLNAWGSKNRIVCTHLGNLAFAAMESPEPAFCDWGGGEVGEDGICPIVLTPEYAAAITGQALRWLVTPVGGDGGLWVERTDCGALVHGTPGSRFDWLCIGVQRDMAGLYAPVSGTAPPPERDDAAELAKTASMAEEISEHDYYKEADIA